MTLDEEFADNDERQEDAETTEENVDEDEVIEEGRVMHETAAEVIRAAVVFKFDNRLRVETCIPFSCTDFSVMSLLILLIPLNSALNLSFAKQSASFEFDVNES